MRLLSPGMFDSLIDDFYEYMEVKTKPTTTTRDKWFTRLNGCLEADVEQAFEKMKDTEGQKPRNMPKAVRTALYLVWADQGRNLNEWVDYGQCPDCNGSGFFVIRYYHKGQKSWPECIIFCKSCDTYLNYAASSAPRASAQFLRMKGARFKPGKTPLRDGPIIEKSGEVEKLYSPKKLTGGTGKHLSDKEKQAFVEMFAPKAKA